MLAGLSYRGSDSIYGRQMAQRRPSLFGPFYQRPRHELLALVLECVHPGNLGALPPSPEALACKGEQIGLGKYSEFFV